MVIFKPGDIVERSYPMVHTLSVEHRGKRCDQCFQKWYLSFLSSSLNLIYFLKSFSNTLKRCAQCGHMYYCSKQCQIGDWKNVHRHECQLFKSNGRLESDIPSILLRSYIAAKYHKNAQFRKYRTWTGRDRCLDDLMDHAEEIAKDETRKPDFDIIADTFIQAKVLDVEDRDLLFSLYGKLLTNAFGIADLSDGLECVELGTGFYIETSAFDHSCEPNAVWQFDGIEMQIVCIREIDTEKDAIFIHYIQLELPRKVRQTKLREQYNFDCECTRCVREKTSAEDDIDYERLAELKKKLNNTYNAFEEIQLRMEMLPMYEKVYGCNHPNIELLKNKINMLKSF